MKQVPIDPEVRAAAVRRLVAGETATAIGAELGVHRTTVVSWTKGEDAAALAAAAAKAGAPMAQQEPAPPAAAPAARLGAPQARRPKRGPTAAAERRPVAERRSGPTDAIAKKPANRQAGAAVDAGEHSAQDQAKPGMQVEAFVGDLFVAGPVERVLEALSSLATKEQDR